MFQNKIFVTFDKYHYNLFRSKLKMTDILIYDKNLNSYTVSNNKLLEYNDIILPPSLLNFKYAFSDKNENMVINNSIDNSIILRENQKEIIETFFYIYNRYENHPLYILMSCPCGFGKTILSIDIIYKLKLKCLIIVPRKFVIKQWYDKISKNINVFTSINGRKNAIKEINNNLNCDIFICPDKHLENDIIKNYIYKNFNFVIIDEIHKYNLNKNIAITKFLYGKYFKLCLFLSATPSNNMNLMINESIKVERKENNIIKKKLISFEPYSKRDIKIINPRCNKIIEQIRKDKFKNAYIKNYNYKFCISLDSIRNETIIKLVSEITQENTRAILLTDYRNHMFDIFNILKKSNLSKITYVYDVKDKNCIDMLNIFKNKNSFLIISTISACSESLDIINLNTFHILLPMSNITTITQCIGRILRNLSDDKYIYMYNFSYINDILRTFINDKSNTIKKQLTEWNFNTIYFKD